jgi:hypothetical protein
MNDHSNSASERAAMTPIDRVVWVNVYPHRTNAYSSEHMAKHWAIYDPIRTAVRCRLIELIEETPRIVQRASSQPSPPQLHKYDQVRVVDVSRAEQHLRFCVGAVGTIIYIKESQDLPYLVSLPGQGCAEFFAASQLELRKSAS